MSGNVEVVKTVHVGLAKPAAEAHDEIMSVTGLRGVDVINRALVLYAFMESQRRAGKNLLVGNPDGTTQYIYFL